MKEKGLVLDDATVGTVVIRWHLNVGGYKLDDGALSIKIVADEDGGAHPIRGVLGGAVQAKEDVWLTIDLDRVLNLEIGSHEIIRSWQKVKKAAYLGEVGMAALAADGGNDKGGLERFAYDVEMSQRDVKIVKEARGGDASVVFLVGR